MVSGDYHIAPGAEISTTTVLGNGYLDWANDIDVHALCRCWCRLWLGDGSGGAADKDGLALGLAAGVAVDLTNNLAVDVGYRFRDIMISGPDT